MRVRAFTLVVIGVAMLFAGLSNIDFARMQAVVVREPDFTSPNLPSPTATPSSSWVILPTLPASATQADIGAELYRLTCSPCHGDRGQGLTDEWRATWPADHQSCWQAKCHGPSHPSDGFQLPRYAPAIIGPKALARFETALQLYDYNRTLMPWPNPGGLVDEKEWQVTAFLVRENAVDLIQVPLDKERAAHLRLHPELVATRPASASVINPSPTALAPQPVSREIAGGELGVWVITLVLLLCAAVALGIWYKWDR
jgi:mono/diheme cytochrome c family protein